MLAFSEDALSFVETMLPFIEAVLPNGGDPFSHTGDAAMRGE